MEGCLRVSAIRPIPARIPVGGGTAIFLDGLCSHPAGPLEDLRVSVDGIDHPVLAAGMLPPEGFKGSDYWWAIVPFEAVSRPRLAQLRLRARTARGEEALGELGNRRASPLRRRRRPRAPFAKPGGGSYGR
ncbi:MAG: hypothetical protein WKF33_05310 [Thermoleophilaceae bacterium]